MPSSSVTKYRSSSGEMKMSLRLMICPGQRPVRAVPAASTYVFVPDVLQQLQLTVRALRQHRRAERLHDLLHRHRLVRESVLGAAHEAERAHADRLQVDIARGHLKDRAKDGQLYEVGHPCGVAALGAGPHWRGVGAAPLM